MGFFAVVAFGFVVGIITQKEIDYATPKECPTVSQLECKPKDR